MIQNSISELLNARAVLKLHAVESKQVVSGFHIWLKQGTVVLTAFLFPADVTVH